MNSENQLPVRVAHRYIIKHTVQKCSMEIPAVIRCTQVPGLLIPMGHHLTPAHDSLRPHFKDICKINMDSQFQQKRDSFPCIIGYVKIFMDTPLSDLTI